MSYEILQYSTLGSIIIQFITGLIGAYGLTIPLATKDLILKQVLGLEKRVKHSAIEGTSVTQLDALPLNANSF